MDLARVFYSVIVLFMTVNSDRRRTALAAICTSRQCTFHLDVTLYKTMTYRDEYLMLRPVQLNGSQLQANVNGDIRNLSASEVILADGFPRDVILINGQFPGPTIEVTEGAQVIVRVNNRLTQKAMTIHWHGVRQNNTFYMDGAAGLTQCPIPPGQSFTYRFWADPVGTHWYHSHVAAQRLDGLFGMFIVHPAIPTVPYFPIFVNDWSHVTTEELELGVIDLCENGAAGAPYRIPGIQPGGDCSFEGAEVDPTIYQSSLLGGRNRWQNQRVPLAEYVVKVGKRYRFRMVHSGHAFPFQIRIDGHRLNIVATDGADIQPIQVDSFFIFVGERVDFEIVADQHPGRYWMRAETQCPGAYANAIVAYDGFQDRIDDPNSLPRICTAQSPCVVFNCPFGSYPAGSNRTCIPMAAANSTASSDDLRNRYGIGDQNNVIEYVLNVAMVAGASINGRRFMMPSQPPFQDPSSSIDCVGEPCLDGCSCRCTNKLTLPFGRTIQLVITNLQPNPNVTQHFYHVMHLHGQNFAVMAEGFPKYDSVTGRIISPNPDITCGSDVLCAHPRWSGTPPNFSSVRQPVIKDTVVLPVRGYTVVRFITQNPGYWLFHCHIDVHMESGMALFFAVSPDRLPEIPYGFPTCHEFIDSCDNLSSNNMTVPNYY